MPGGTLMNAKYRTGGGPLLRYCELDTMAMVFVWEYFNEKCKQ